MIRSGIPRVNGLNNLPS